MRPTFGSRSIVNYLSWLLFYVWKSNFWSCSKAEYSVHSKRSQGYLIRFYRVRKFLFPRHVLYVENSS